MGSRLLRYYNRFTGYISDAIELKLGRMILAISPYNRSESDFPGFPPGDAFVACLSKISNRFTAYSIHSIELKLGVIIPSYESAKSVLAGFFQVQKSSSEFQTFFADVIPACSFDDISLYSDDTRHESA